MRPARLTMWPSSTPGRAGVRRVPVRRVEIVEAVRDRLLAAPMAVGEVEPHLVAPDRAADGRVDVPDLLDLADVDEPVVRVVGEVAGEVVAEVVGDPVLGRAVGHDRSAEGVAAVARHHVDADAALPHFGGVGAGDVADFLEAAVVPIHAAVGALRAEVVQADAFDRLHRVGRSRGTAAATAAGCPSRRRRATARRRRPARAGCRES